MNWDDLRIFLAIVQYGSVRKAAEHLNINQSTVSRRISAFEQAMEVQLFIRLPSGYELTKAGKEIIERVNIIDSEVSSIKRSLAITESPLNGVLKVSLPVPLATDLLMPQIAKFSQLYPNVKVEISASSQNANLAKREADISIRILKIGDTPPPYVIGKKLVTYMEAVYVSSHLHGKQQNWISNSPLKTEENMKGDNYERGELTHSIDHLMTTLSAVKAGLGIARLPCCFADTDSELRRVMPQELFPGREIWLISHPDFKGVEKVKIFKQFINQYFDDNRGLFEGRMNSDV